MKKKQKTIEEVAAESSLAVAKQVPVQIEDVDGIARFALILEHGITELWAGNGGRKTRVQEAISDAASQRRDVGVGVTDARRDGADALLGSVTIGDAESQRLLRISRSGSVQRSGKMLASLRIVDPGPVSRLIDPGLQDEEAKRKAQLRAFLELVPLDVSDEHLAQITQGDGEVLDWLRPDLEGRSIGDLLTATKRMRTLVQEAARGQEERREASDRAVSGHDRVLDEIVEEALASVPTMIDDDAPTKKGAARLLTQRWKSPEELDVERRESDRKAAAARERREHYLADVARQEELRETAGEKPSDEDALVLVNERFAAEEDAKSAVDAGLSEVERIQRELAEARRRLERSEANLDAAVQLRGAAEAALEERQESIRSWEAAHAFLECELTGPSEDEVRALEDEAENKGMAIVASRLSRRYHKALDERKTGVADRAAAKNRAERLREIERQAWDKLGELVTRASKVPEVTIHQGWLAYVTPAGEIHDWNDKRVSTGMRNGAAFRLGARCFGQDSILMVEGRFYELLDLDGKMELHRVAKEEQVFGLTEVASFREDGLAYCLVGSPQWVEHFKALAAAAEEVASE